MNEEREDRAVYIISVAAELAGMHPQTLRIYERKGLVRPARTSGNTRRYSDRDIERLRMIQQLTQEEGINLAGVRMIVELERQIEQMRAEVERMHRDLARARQARRRADAASHEVGLVPMRSLEEMFPWMRER
jgi:MerR family transcriptional regulator/heat shock protein HspR